MPALFHWGTQVEKGTSPCPRPCTLQIKYGDNTTSEGVLFATYSALIGESQAGGQHRTRLRQILQWCGEAFEGVVSCRPEAGRPQSRTWPSPQGQGPTAHPCPTPPPPGLALASQTVARDSMLVFVMTPGTMVAAVQPTGMQWCRVPPSWR